ncbi:L-rhamnose mutarotase [Asinibacterium sp. OR53]|jgi:L-rhamnose mutarotase|uniref:L-rhamnose mutarotase n=1 Tax=Asinibacterium sp. OR53 TaxID=925409 RepID=UPI00047870AA|nr:L-rhamnose mutarotase [Asinibacterium sp. OR53]
MKRYCLALDLKDDPSLIEEYEYYHKKEVIWPEIVEGIKACGIQTMDIYRVGNRLMMILETTDDFELQSGFTKMSSLPLQREWAALMSAFQQRLPFARPGEHWMEAKQIFTLNN